MTAAALLLGDAGFALPATGAYSLPVEGGVDALLEAVTVAGRTSAWLPAEGGLVSNLSLLENLLLPLQWRQALPATELESRLAAALQTLGVDAAEAACLHQRPAQADVRDRRLALYLRCLLLAPEVLVLGAGALTYEWQGEPLERALPRWLPHSLLLYAGAHSHWPLLQATPA